MKLLVSAYACEPGKGSEPAVGWNWVQALVRRGYQVHVITRANNQENIESAPGSRHSALTFHYYDLSESARRWKHRRGGIYLYYLLWQWGAFRLAQRLHARERYDLVHHVTFVSWRQPSFMGRLGIPFIFGPVGGGETMPAPLRQSLPLRSLISEAVRNLGNTLIGVDPLMRSTFSSARMIACTTAETLARIPARFRAKCIVQPAIGIAESEIRSPAYDEPDAAHFLFVGRLLYWKGLHLAIRAMDRVRRSLPDARLRIIGTGEDRAWLEAQARAAGVANALDWIASIPHDQMEHEYRRSVALVFPSLHDSGGMVVPEALAAGLPVVCLDLGGPATIATPQCALIVPARETTEAAIEEALAEAMIRLATDRALRARLAANALSRARQLTWDQAVDRLYSLLDPASRA
jgi:glycosyltransferase involved in cell wall biosynthesis